MASIEFAGFLFDDTGAIISGATINLYDRNTVTPVRATTTTAAVTGAWTISHGTEGRFDVEIVNGSSKRRRKYDDAIQLQEIETANLLVRNPANTFKYDIVPAAIAADRQLNLPLLTGTDTIVVLALAQTLTNKTLTTLGVGAAVVTDPLEVTGAWRFIAAAGGVAPAIGGTTDSAGYRLYVGKTNNLTDAQPLILEISQLVLATAPLSLSETTDPAAPAANKALFYCKDNGSGKTQLVVRFPTGAVQVLATEP